MSATTHQSLPPASVLGIGAVTPLGRNLEEIAQRLKSGGSSAAACRVSDELLTDPKLARSLRRADRFVRMAAIAAVDACTNAPAHIVPPEQIGLIVTSGYGAHARGFKFLDGILDCGDADALPTDFSHSVHGVAASYITGLLDLRGPSLTSTDFELGFEHAVLTAQTWLSEKTCRRVLVGAVEELAEPMQTMASRLLPRDLPLGEGAVFLMLSNESIPGKGRIDASMIAARDGIHFDPRLGLSPSSSALNVLARLIHRPDIDTLPIFPTSCRRAFTISVARD